MHWTFGYCNAQFLQMATSHRSFPDTHLSTAKSLRLIPQLSAVHVVCGLECVALLWLHYCSIRIFFFFFDDTSLVFRRALFLGDASSDGPEASEGSQSLKSALPCFIGRVRFSCFLTALLKELSAENKRLKMVNLFITKSDQYQISPAASPEIYITQYEELGFT